MSTNVKRTDRQTEKERSLKLRKTERQIDKDRETIDKERDQMLRGHTDKR